MRCRGSEQYDAGDLHAKLSDDIDLNYLGYAPTRNVADFFSATTAKISSHARDTSNNKAAKAEYLMKPFTRLPLECLASAATILLLSNLSVPAAAFVPAWRAAAGQSTRPAAATSQTRSSYTASSPLSRRHASPGAPVTALTVATPDAASTEAAVRVGTAPLDWDNLGFEYRDVNCHVKFTYKEGEGWSDGELVEESYVKVHIANTAMHYGQAVFEGLKAFHCKDGR